MLTETLTADSSSLLLRRSELQTHFLQPLLQSALSVCVDQLHRQTDTVTSCLQQLYCQIGC